MLPDFVERKQVGRPAGDQPDQVLHQRGPPRILEREHGEEHNG